MTKYFINENGEYLGAFDCEPEFYPQGQEVSKAPNHALEIWNGQEWVMPVTYKNAIIEQQRAARYAVEADPLGMQYLRKKDEAIYQQWLVVVDKIKAELPYEVE